MKQAAVADEPDIPMAIFDNLGDTANKLAVTIVCIASNCFGLWIKLFEGHVLCAKPKAAATVWGYARDVSTP